MEQRKLRAMTVGELIESLKQHPQDMQVVMSYPSGDYWGRVLAKGTDEYDIQPGYVTWSDYHSQWKVDLDADDREDEEAPEGIEVLILN